MVVTVVVLKKNVDAVLVGYASCKKQDVAYLRYF